MSHYQQCRLSQGTGRTVAWLEMKRGVRVGVFVELPDHGGRWRVDVVYSYRLEHEVLVAKQRLDRGSLPSLVNA